MSEEKYAPPKTIRHGVYPFDDMTTYIRADIVEEMREALEQCLRINGYQNAREMITAALKLLEEV